MVQAGRVGEFDRLGTIFFGRLRVDFAAIDARRDLSGVCGRWYPVILSLHRFFIAIPELWLTMTGKTVLLLIHWFGLLVLFPKGAG